MTKTNRRAGEERGYPPSPSSLEVLADRTQFRGVTDIKFFMYRLTKLYS
jgi:hypothetical protein